MRSSPFGTALASAVTRVRERLRDPIAPVLVLAPADGNAALARQQLALATDFIRVEFLAPDRVIRELGRGALEARGLRPQPSGWLAGTVGWAVAHAELGRHGPALKERGWRGALVAAIEALELAGADAERLAALGDDRADLFARLLRVVAAHRQRDRLYTLADLCRAAESAEDRRWAGVVTFGDQRLPGRMFSALRAWLAGRAVVEVLPDAWAALAPAPRGQRAAAAAAEVVPVPAGAVELALVRTPDDVRELHEAAREVVAAVREGVPLDRIAVVLPDAQGVEVLRAALDAAEVPAVWQVGAPLAQTPSARFLLHAVAVATGEDSRADWYELLRQPGVRWARVDPEILAGRARWRRLLAECGAPRDVDQLIPAVAAQAAGDPDATTQRAAAANLIRALQALKVAVAPLRQDGALGDHAARWTALVRSWWAPSPDRERLLSVLGGFGAPGVGAPLTADEAREVLADVLAGAPVHEGSFSDPAVRVLTPMGVLGGAFDRVIATGFVEGRFPRLVDEDPLLSDALVEALAAVGIALDDRATVRDFEDRRLAAIRSSCTGRLWLSAPAVDHGEGRPLVPSRFLLDLASEQAGRRVGYRDLALTRAGSRSTWGPSDPARALGGVERQVALVRAGGERVLAGHPIAPRLLAGVPDEPRIEPSLVPWPERPLSAYQIGLLAENPAAFLVDVVWRVAECPSLDDRDPYDRRDLLRRLNAAVNHADSTGEPAVLARWDADAAEWARFRTDVDLERMRREARLSLAQARACGNLGDGPVVRPEGKPIPELPWVVRGEAVRVDGDLARWSRPTAERDDLAKARFVLTTVLCGATAGRVDGLDSAAQQGDLSEAQRRVLARLRDVAAEVAGGRWTWTADHPVRIVVTAAEGA